MIHVQFETIHPFLDGNGRLLIALLLEAWGLLDARLLYLSLHFRRNQQEYYRHLDAVRTQGDWEGWARFFLQGVHETARQAIATSRSLFRIIAADRARLLASKRAIVPAIRLFEELPSHPVVTIRQVVRRFKITKPTAGKAVGILIGAGTLKERLPRHI